MLSFAAAQHRRGPFKLERSCTKHHNRPFHARLYVTNGDRRAMEVIRLIANRTIKDINYRQFTSSDEMVSFYKNFRSSQNLGLGLVFENGSKSNGLAYTMRMPSENSPSVNTKIEDENRHGEYNPRINSKQSVFFLQVIYILCIFSLNTCNSGYSHFAGNLDETFVKTSL